MRKVIDGHEYDTEQATLLAVYNKTSCGSMNCFRECLFINDNNEFFLYGEGAPGTRYGNREDFTHWQCGEDIVPLTADEAQIWLANYNFSTEMCND